MTYDRNDRRPASNRPVSNGPTRQKQRHSNNQPRGNRSRSPLPAHKARPPKEERKIYFIALLPNAEVGKEVIRLKQEFAENYESRRALKVLPHITLQVPFTTNTVIEKELSVGLTEFAATIPPFEIQLDGFGGVLLQHRKVLFINVLKNEGISHLHHELVQFLRKDFGFSPMLAKYGFNPHISLAFRDLSEDEFAEALHEYSDKDFTASFKVRNIYLLRHTGTSWEVLQKCPLGGV
jgi:2'-5' RNA ligase